MDVWEPRGLHLRGNQWVKFLFLFSDISWDARSQISVSGVSRLAPRTPQPNYYAPHPPHQPQSRALDQIERLKKQIQEEYLRVQYSLEREEREHQLRKLRRPRSLTPQYRKRPKMAFN